MTIPLLPYPHPQPPSPNTAPAQKYEHVMCVTRTKKTARATPCPRSSSRYRSTSRDSFNLNCGPLGTKPLLYRSAPTAGCFCGCSETKHKSILSAETSSDGCHSSRAKHLTAVRLEGRLAWSQHVQVVSAASPLGPLTVDVQLLLSFVLYQHCRTCQDRTSAL